MSCVRLLSDDAKRTSIGGALLAVVTQLLFLGSLFGGFHAIIA